tara:strand:+ start:2480 stop:3028 length:549 start_codon:yes stop_codon:yes gene_type:complete
MKKLTSILFISLMLSCSSESKKEPNPFSPGDKWIEFGQTTSDSEFYDYKVDWNDPTDEIYYEFTEDNKIISDFFGPEKDPSSVKFSDNKDTITDEYYIEGKKVIDIFKPIFYSKDTLVLEYYESNDKGYKYKKFLKLYPKYQPDEARAILMSTKSDLDLEIITQKQYDSVKKIMTRYINWKQ